MAQEKPLLFLDVDGVLNCWAYMNEDDFDFITVTDNSGKPEQVVVPKETSLHIELLAMSFDIVWATAWLGAAHTAFREHLDLPIDSWPHLDYERFKIVEILRFAGERPWAWVDDIAAWELQQIGWHNVDFWDGDTHKRPNRYLNDNTMIICPDGRYGLTKEHVEKLVKFAYDNTPVAADETEFLDGNQNLDEWVK